MMEEVTRRQNGCFEHPFITMVNTLKNNDYVKNFNGSGWSKGDATFSTALDAYMDYLEMCNACMKNTEEHSDDEEV